MSTVQYKVRGLHESPSPYTHQRGVIIPLSSFLCSVIWLHHAKISLWPRIQMPIRNMLLADRVSTVMAASKGHTYKHFCLRETHSHLCTRVSKNESWGILADKHTNHMTELKTHRKISDIPWQEFAFKIKSVLKTDRTDFFIFLHWLWGQSAEYYGNG